MHWKYCSLALSQRSIHWEWTGLCLLERVRYGSVSCEFKVWYVLTFQLSWLCCMQCDIILASVIIRKLCWYVVWSTRHLSRVSGCDRHWLLTPPRDVRLTVSCNLYRNNHSGEATLKNMGINHYNEVIITTMESQITSLTVVNSTVYSDADQIKHQSSASLAFVWGIHRDQWIPRTKGQLRGKCFHLMTSSCRPNTVNHSKTTHN